MQSRYCTGYILISRRKQSNCFSQILCAYDNRRDTEKSGYSYEINWIPRRKYREIAPFEEHDAPYFDRSIKRALCNESLKTFPILLLNKEGNRFDSPASLSLMQTFGSFLTWHFRDVISIDVGHRIGGSLFVKASCKAFFMSFIRGSNLILRSMLVKETIYRIVLQKEDQLFFNEVSLI